MGCYEQPAITAITPVMAAPITLSGDKAQTEPKKMTIFTEFSRHPGKQRGKERGEKERKETGCEREEKKAYAA